MMDGQIRLTTPEPTTLLNLNITKRDNSNIVCLSNNAKGSVLHHLANIFAPLPKKKKSRLNLIMLLDQYCSTELSALMEYFISTPNGSHEAPVTNKHLKHG